jgi:hypothetical protein
MVDRARLDQLLAHAERVHEILRTELGDFDRFAEQVTAYADRR